MTLLRTEHLTKIYISGLFRRHRTPALRDASISIGPGETVGIYGKSGSGKDYPGQSGDGDPPGHRRANLLGEPTLDGPLPGRPAPNHPDGGSASRGGLRPPVEPGKEPDGALPGPPHTLLPGALPGSAGSGGPLRGASPPGPGLPEWRRTAAGGPGPALSMEPRLLLLDEPTSMLDAISQAQILQILKDYQASHGTAYLLITHDLAVMRHMCTRCYFLADGCVTGEEEVHGKTESDPPLC